MLTQKRQFLLAKPLGEEADRINELNVEKKQVDILQDTLEGYVLGKKYQVNEFMDAGSIGQIYKVTDLCDPRGRPLVAKI